MKKSQLKQLIREIADELLRNPEYVAGYRSGEKAGLIGEPKDVSSRSDTFKAGYKAGYSKGRMSRWGEKLTGGLTKLGQYFGSDTGFHRKF